MRRLQTKVGRLQTILGNVGGWCYLCSVIMDKREGRLRSGSWFLRSLIVWKAERCYLWSIDVGRADPEKPNSKESKGRKGLRFYE